MNNVFDLVFKGLLLFIFFVSSFLMFGETNGLKAKFLMNTAWATSTIYALLYLANLYLQI